MKRFLCLLLVLLTLNSCSTNRYEKIEFSFDNCLAKVLYYGDNNYELVVYDGLIDDNFELIGLGAIASINFTSPNTNDTEFPLGEFSTKDFEINKARLKYNFLNNTYIINSCSAVVIVEKNDNNYYKLNLSLCDGTKSYKFSYLGLLTFTTMNNE